MIKNLAQKTSYPSGLSNEEKPYFKRGLSGED
jgi:hypothetical protein